MHRLTRTTSLIAVLGLTVSLAACGAQGGGSTTPSSQATSQPTNLASSPGASEDAGGSPEAYVVGVMQGTLGAYLVGEDGKTLYILTKDSAGTSTCSGGCATAWPPFTLDEGETVSAGTGVTATIATIKRPDGSDQVAINGQPLYYYAGDSAAGDTNGQGSNGVWFVAAPGGGGVGAPASGAGNY
jgi:predicted lipoprotein with Yx(FWY)xxD motif